MNSERKTCSTNPIGKYIRIFLSLLIIGLGIYFKNWVGILGLLTLYTAFTGKCGTSITIGRKSSGYRKVKFRDNP